MKKNGYTIIELLVIVILLGVASFITIRSVSHALVDNKEELYQDDVHSILDSAKLYGIDNLEELKSNHSIIVTVQDLIDKSYLGSDEEGNFISCTECLSDPLNCQVEIYDYSNQANMDK